MPTVYEKLTHRLVTDGIITFEQYLQIPGYEYDSMDYLFSPDGLHALADGIITFEQYLQIPWYDRYTTAFLFSPDGRHAIADGIITLEQYLKLPLVERYNMRYLFSPKGRQALADGVITFEQHLQISLVDERDTMEYVSSPDGWQAITDGIITREQYLQIPWKERCSMEYLFSSDGRYAITDGIITFDQYLQIPCPARNSMQCIFSPDGRQAITEGIITLEQYLQIPWYERYGMKYLFSSDGLQAITEGIITLEQYLQIPWYERYSMSALFSPDGRKTFTDSLITLEQYLQIPSNERAIMGDLFSPDGRQAITDGVITLEQYLQISHFNRFNLADIFSPDGRQAIAEGIITLEQYLQIPWKDRFSLEAFFSPDGRQTVIDGIITLEQYLQIRWNERDTLKYFFSPEGRQAVAEGIITLEQYLQIPSTERFSMSSLFSPDGRQAVAEGIITFGQFLQVPYGERGNVIRALENPDTRRRIRNGEIAIENVIGVQRARDVAVRPINGVQNTHTASVHQSVSESASRLLNLYESGINGAGLEKTIEKEQNYINSLSDDAPKNQAAKRGFSRIVAIDYIFTDSLSKVSIRQLLALTFLAIHDDEKRVGSLEDAKMQFVEALYEIQRGYNLSETGIDDQKDKDEYICSAGTFNKLIEKLQGIHPDCRILYITIATASLKLPIVVREESMRYLATFAKSHLAEKLLTFNCLITQIIEEGVEVIWDHIENDITTRMFDEFGSLYKDRTDSHFTALVKVGKEVELNDLSFLQQQVQSVYLTQQSDKFLQTRKKDIRNPEEILIYAQINRQLNQVENKAKNLCNRGHTLAYCKAIGMVHLLRDLNQDYFKEKKIDYKIYKVKAFGIIYQARHELDKHRGYKKIFGNLLILIATLGTGQLLNKAFNGHFLFFKKTDSSKHIDTLHQLIEKVKVFA